MDNSNNNRKQQLQQIPPQPHLQQAPPQQPQFQQAPQQPQQFQQMPPQPMAGAPYQMPPKKSKGVLWGIIGGVIGLIIIIVGIVLAILFLSGPSKSDYKDAVSLVSQMKLPESKDIFKDVKKSDDYEEVINKVINSADEAHAKFASNKVFKDIEVKEAYDKYLKVWNDEAKPYLKYVGIFNKEGAYRKCKVPNPNKYFEKSKDEIEQDFDSVMKSCTNALDNMIKSDNDIAKKYGEDLKKHYAEMKQYYVAAVAYRQDYVRTKGQTSLSLPKVPTTPTPNYKKDIAKRLKDDLNNLQKVLEDKANK